MTSYQPGFADAECIPLPPLRRLGRGQVHAEIEALLRGCPQVVLRFVMLPDAKYGDLVGMLAFVRQAHAPRYALSKLLAIEEQAIAVLR